MTPFTQHPEESVARLGEVALLREIRRWLGPAAPPSPFGMGDDTAVLAKGDRELFTSDSLVHGRHFDDSVTATQAGAKLLKRNLSDIAAMGGNPREAVLAGFLPPETRLDWLEAFTRGIAACAIEWGVSVVGGDLTQTEGFLGFNLTLLGSMEPNTEPLLRTGAAAGDQLWVTGTLGGSLAEHHFSFNPRLPEGKWLARRGRSEIRALIDVTDGLAKDLPGILPSNCAAALQLAKVPVSAAAESAAQKSGRTALAHALTDGEDYELLFVTAAGVDPKRFAAAWKDTFSTPLTLIGEIVSAPTDEGGRLIDAKTGKPLEENLHGYEHFGRT